MKEREPQINKVEIFETLNFDANGTVERKILVNGELVHEEKTVAKMDWQSTSRLKQFIDWLIGVKITEAQKAKKQPEQNDNHEPVNGC